MKKLGLLAMAGVVMLSGCGGDDDEVEDLLREPSAVFFHNQLAGTTRTDTTVDLVARNNLSEPLFENRQYSTTEQDGVAFQLDADTETVVFDVNNDTTTLVDDQSLELKAGQSYTLVLMGQVSGSGGSDPILRNYQQSVAAVSDSEVRIRLIHALSGLSGQPLAVSVGGDFLADGFVFGQATDYEAVAPASDETLELNVFRYAMWNGVDQVDCEIEAGKSYDVIITHPAYDSEVVEIFCQQVRGS
ncbi:MAG: hypothetical protein ACFE0K_04655 [Alcanivorax sp.]|uniref:hypothetical protein n=1 Tax=Alcanivorax sp. TaxID=1872427 RepID=UPI003DA6F129